MSHSQQLKVEHPRKLTSRQSISCQYWMGLGWFRAKPYPSPCSCAGPAVLHEGSDGAPHIPQAKLSSTSPNQQRKVPKQAYIAGCVDVDWCWLPDYAWLADWYFLVFGQCSIYIYETWALLDILRFDLSWQHATTRRSLPRVSVATTWHDPGNTPAPRWWRLDLGREIHCWIVFKISQGHHGYHG